MQPQIIEIAPHTIIGFTNRHQMPEVKYTSDIPAYWDKINMEYSPLLSRLHHTFIRSTHCEIGICFDADLKTGEFTYMSVLE